MWIQVGQQSSFYVSTKWGSDHVYNTILTFQEWLTMNLCSLCNGWVFTNIIYFWRWKIIRWLHQTLQAKNVYGHAKEGLDTCFIVFKWITKTSKVNLHPSLTTTTRLKFQRLNFNFIQVFCKHGILQNNCHILILE